MIFTLGESPRTFLAGDFIDNYLPLREPYTRLLSLSLQAATVEMHEVRWYLHGQTVNRALASGYPLLFRASTARYPRLRRDRDESKGGG